VPNPERNSGNDALVTASVNAFVSLISFSVPFSITSNSVWRESNAGSLDSCDTKFQCPQRRATKEEQVRTLDAAIRGCSDLTLRHPNLAGDSKRRPVPGVSADESDEEQRAHLASAFPSPFIVVYNELQEEKEQADRGTSNVGRS